jgi:uncharacterized protein
LPKLLKGVIVNNPAKKPNRLIHATSPYLLQHAYNPVDWYEWGPEALERSAKEDKPILVSIGYSACHWCHVMERESFEVDSIANLMNEHFICIKVDREERPDIDQIYIEAVQAMNSRAGWPLNAFLTPDQKPFYGGTYFPPAQWSSVLKQISAAFHQRRKDIMDSATSVSELLLGNDIDRFGSTGENSFREDLDPMFQSLRKSFDEQWGGLDRAPKFVMPSVWIFLLRYSYLKKDAGATNMVQKTLTTMCRAGLYDQLAGGFSRYSVDREWFAPHFEKMLYDNAQLLSLYAEAFAASKNPLFKTIAFETIRWLKNEMTHSDGGFYSAIDADSEGMEGKFYSWTWEKFQSVFGDQAETTALRFGVTKDGNWEHGRNILFRPEVMNPEENAKLLTARSQRIRPSTDDKILTSWNALTIQGLVDCYRTFQNPEFLWMAKRAIQFLERELIHDGIVYRSYRGKRSEIPGFLEDYSFLIQAYTALHEVTFEETYLHRAAHWCQFVLDSFFDPSDGFFFFTSSRSESLLTRKKEIFDNVIPSSNSVMARNLFRLGTHLDRRDWKELSKAMINRLENLIRSEPSSMSNWGILIAEIAQGLTELVICGPDAVVRRQNLGVYFLPFTLTTGSSKKSDLPLLANRFPEDGKTLFYVCFDQVCQQPVESIEEAVDLIVGG